MKFILYLLKRILILSIALLIPTAIAFVGYNVLRLGIQPYNLGIRSIFNVAFNQLPSIIFTSYMLAIIFSIVLIDKTKINNLFILHLPPIIITIIILSLFYAFNIKQKSGNFFVTSDSNIKIGFNIFFKQSVFNELGNNIIYINYKNGKFISFMYNKQKNVVIPLKKISFSTDKLIVHPIAKNSKLTPIKINYNSFPKNSHFFSGKLIENYSLKLEKLTNNVKRIYYSLNQNDKLIFLSAFIFSFIIFIVPLSFLLNDGGWGTTGLIGVVLILSIIPFLYNFVFRFTFATELKHKNVLSFLGRYKYLICPIIFFLLGFFMDLFIKLFHKAEV